MHSLQGAQPPLFLDGTASFTLNLSVLLWALAALQSYKLQWQDTSEEKTQVVVGILEPKMPILSLQGSDKEYSAPELCNRL